MMMSTHESLPSMLHDSGSVFDDAELAEHDAALRALDNSSREAYRNRNADAIASSDADRLLVVAGPGTGKSYLFLARIRSWLKRHPGERIYVCSFVRKLVRDLQSDVAASDLSPAEKALVTVTTLHGLARSLVERNHGTSELRFAPHIRMIGAAWKDVVWSDVVSLHPELDSQVPFEELESQFHGMTVPTEDPWPLRRAYLDICRYYNAMGFADSILHAIEAVKENPELNELNLWIVDEFQDFNAAEAELLSVCMGKAAGLVLAGDDDQALYQSLKASHPEIIRAYYRDDQSLAKAMLPFCGRCSYHICMGATGFLERQREDESIRKVFLPVEVDESASRIQVVVCSTPSAAVGYTIDFIDSHRDELEQRRQAIIDGEKKDPQLLVLSPVKDVATFYREAAAPLIEALEEWRLEAAGPGVDYFRVLTYFGNARNPDDNFTMRKVLAYESAPELAVHEVLGVAFKADRPLAKEDHDIVRAALRASEQVERILRDEQLTVAEKALALASVVLVEDPDRLTMDLEAFPVGQDVSRADEHEEEIETAGTISPAELMTMVSAKGLSADHVIVLGFDNVNMGWMPPQQFFVAMTRARRSLHLITALQARGSSSPHSFLDDIPTEHCEYVKRTAQQVTGFTSRSNFMDYFKAVAWARSKAMRRNKR